MTSPIMSLFQGLEFIEGADGNAVTPNITVGSADANDIPLIDEYNYLRTQVYGRFLQSMREDERYYRLEFGDDLIPPEWRSRGFKPTLPPTAYNAIEAASNHILTTPDIMVPERPTEEDALQEQSIAAQKASALLFFWHQIFKQGDPLFHAKKDAIKWGKIVLKKSIDFDAIDLTGTNIGKSAFPWKIVQLTPSQVFEDPTDPYDPQFIYEAYETTVHEAKRLFPNSVGTWSAGKQPWHTVRVLEYWEKPKGYSAGRRVIWIERERVLNKPNPYSWLCSLDANGRREYDGYLPYFIADSGWGDGDVGAAPHERYIGMIRRIHSLLETEARQLTAADAQLRVSTFPLIKMTNIEEDDEHPIKLGPGAKIHIDETQNIETVQWPQLDPALFNIISQVHKYANELTQFQTLSGIPQSGVDSATEADQNYRSASAKLAGILSAMKSVITRINETMLMDIEYVIEAPVTLFGAADGMPGAITLDPSMIAGFYENFVELKTSDEKALDAANAVRWANLYQVFGLDKRYAMKMAGIANPQQRIAMREQEDVWSDPQMHQLRVAQALRGQAGEFGEMLYQNTINAMLNGVVPTDTDDQGGAAAGGPPVVNAQEPGIPVGGEGGFPPMIGAPNVDGQTQQAPGVAAAPTPPPIQRNAARSIGFNKALMQNPSLAFSG